jgi:O-antigen/teichoic acid export membrane protein
VRKYRCGVATPVEESDRERSNPAPEGEESLTRDELRRRASAGVFIVATRGLLILVLSFVGNVVVARLLTPHDFGVVAIGMSFVYFVSLLSDGGLGAALIRRPEPPERRELQALMALQLGVTLGLAAAVTAGAAFFGGAAWVVALMVSSMPLAMLQFPGRILLERSLRYRPLAIVELSQVLVYHAWAIGFVIAGFGVWGLASATVAMRAAGAIAMAAACPAGVVAPRFGWRRVQPLLGFGLRFQAASAMALVQEQGLNAAIAAVASVSTLGLWSLARRLMEVPFVLFDSLWRVSYPTMSKLVASDEDVAPLLERAVGMAAIASGVILTGLAGSAPGLIPGVFGEQWRGAAAVVPPACLGLAIGGALSVATVGYLYAVGDATSVLRAHVLRTITMFAVALPLLPSLGAVAAGLGWLASSVVDGVVVGRAAAQRTGARLWAPLMAPLAIGIAAAGVGWLVAELGGRDLASGLAGGACSVLIFVAGLGLLRAALLRDTLSFAWESVRRARSRPAPSTVA